MYCVDSLKAFRELDEKFEKIENSKKLFTMLEADEKDKEKLLIVEEPQTSADGVDPLELNSKIDWRLNNETTPQRRASTTKNGTKNGNLLQTHMHAKRRSVSLSVRRSLFTDNFKPKTKYPPKGVYKLGNIYKRCFNQEPVNLHRAESDVEVLTKLILYYGLDFLAYCEQRKQPFSKVPKLGSSI